jgi:predicted dehydrogenase
VVHSKTFISFEPNAEKMSQIIKVGLIGAGRWGPNVIGAVNRINEAKLLKVADPNQESLSNLNLRFPGVTTSHSPTEIFKDDQIDAVAICTPVETHTELVKSALESGKHVFVEKPFGHDTKTCESLCLLAKNKNLIIVVGHVFLFNASVIALKKIIQSGELGKVLHLEAHRTNLGPVRKDVNAVWDLTSHDLSIFDFLLDDLAEEVSCLGSCKLDSKNEDTTYSTFKYQGGILAHAHASWLNPRKVRQITVIGSKKMALWDDLNLEHPITIYDSSIGLDQSYYSDSFASHRLSYNRGNVVLPSIPTNEPLLEEIKHFIDVIQGKEENRSSGSYGTEVVKTLQVADKSLQNGGKFLTISRK